MSTPEKTELSMSGRITVSFLLIITVALESLSIAYLAININRMLKDIKFINAKINPGYWFGDPADYPDTIYYYLWESSIDLSTATPLILILLFYFPMKMFFQLLMGNMEKNKILHDYVTLPYTSGYQTAWVQYGLMGTLWAFLIIGVEMRDGIKNDSINILVNAFGTALLSTFTAVISAYLLSSFVKVIFLYVLRKGLKEPVDWDADIADNVANLEFALLSLTNTITGLNKGTKTLTDTTSDAEQALKKIDLDWTERIDENFMTLANALTQMLTAQQTQWEGINEEVRTIKSSVLNLDKQVNEKLNTKTSDLSNKIDDINKKYKAHATEIENISLKLDPISASIKTVNNNTKETKKNVTTIHNNLRETNETVAENSNKIENNIAETKNINNAISTLEKSVTALKDSRVSVQHTTNKIPAAETTDQTSDKKAKSAFKRFIQSIIR